MTGASPKCREKRSGSIVAEVMITLRSGRRGQQLLEVAEQEVDVEAALVRLVDDDRVVARAASRSRWISASRMPSVMTLTQRVVADLVGEAHLVADGLAERRAQLLGDALGDGARGDPARLGVPDQPADAAAELEADLRQLRGLARPGLAGDDDDLVVADRGGDVVLALADRQVGRVRRPRQPVVPLAHAALRGVHLAAEPGERDLAVGLGGRPDGVEPPAQPAAVAVGQLGQPPAELVDDGLVRGVERGRRPGPAALDRRTAC